MHSQHGSSRDRKLQTFPQVIFTGSRSFLDPQIRQQLGIRR
jgi:hypothetical protein